MNVKALALNTFVCCCVGILAACSSSSDSSAPTSTSISGSIFAAAVSNADVSVKDMSGNTIAGPVTTSADGSFTVSIANTDLASDLVFQSTGGTFTDEASAAITSAGSMSVMAEAGSLGSSSSSIHATPGSKIIHQLVTQHAMSMTAANTAFKNAFGYTPDHTIAPTDATNPDAGADQAQLLAGLRAATFSQLAKDLGLTAAQQFDLFTALAQDLSDSLLNGEDSMGPVSVGGMNLPEDIQNRFTLAVVNFRSSGNDNTGLDNAQIGTLPFATVALTDSFKVEYLPGMMDAMEGKTNFKLSISNLSDGSPASALSPGLMPMMHMADRTHSTPVDAIINNGDGSYTATVYYLMPSTMMTGDSMGYWDLGVMVNMSETTHFFPDVMMAMGDTPRVTLKGLDGDDVIPSMLGDTPRNYLVFNGGLTETVGNQHKFEVFLAAMESMMKFPAIDVGLVMNASTAYELTVSSVAVEMSSDDGASWVTANNDGSGHFSANLSGLTTGTAAPVRVRVKVNGVYKTTDAAAPVTDTNDYQTFTATPAP